jgi:hypothetical protein
MAEANGVLFFLICSHADGLGVGSVMGAAFRCSSAGDVPSDGGAGATRRQGFAFNHGKLDINAPGHRAAPTS